MAIHRKHLKDNGIKIVSVMENIPDSPEGVLLESLLEGFKHTNGHKVFYPSEIAFRGVYRSTDSRKCKPQKIVA